MAVRVATLSVASRNNKSLREQDLEFKVRDQIPQKNGGPRFTSKAAVQF